MRTHRSLPIATAIGLFAAATLASGITPTAQAAAHDYPVMNTSEYPPDGIYFRSGPDWAKAVRVTGFGVYAGDIVRLQCYERGSNVPRRDGGSNNVWYLASNVTRPTVPLPDGRVNAGWINAHFVNDGTGPNDVAPGVPGCVNGAPPAAEPPPPADTRPVFYAGDGNDVPTLSPNANVRLLEQWSDPSKPGQCVTSKADDDVPTTTRTLTGFSKGRLGPIYYFKHGGPAAMQQIDYVLMIDPGNLSNLSGCDSDPRIRAGSVLADWLKNNKSARLVILAGKITGEKKHKGIQEVYFNAIRSAQKGDGVERSSRVLVCNYGGGPWSHDDHHKAMFRGANYYVQRAPITRCPRLDGVAQIAPVNGWNPGR